LEKSLLGGISQAYASLTLINDTDLFSLAFARTVHIYRLGGATNTTQRELSAQMRN